MEKIDYIIRDYRLPYLSEHSQDFEWVCLLIQNGYMKAAAFVFETIFWKDSKDYSRNKLYFQNEIEKYFEEILRISTVDLWVQSDCVYSIRECLEKDILPADWLNDRIDELRLFSE